MKSNRVLYYSKFVLLLVCICGLIYSCSKASGLLPSVSPMINVKPSPNTVEANLGFNNNVTLHDKVEDVLPIVQPGGGLGLALFDQDGNIYPNKVLSTGQDIRFYLTLFSYLPNNISYKLIQFVDFDQTPIIVDEEKYYNGFNFTMPSNTYACIPISLHFSNAGLHELLYVFIISPENNSVDEEYRLKTETSNLLQYRLFTKVNDESKPALSVIYAKTSVIKDNSKKFGSLRINKDENILSAWLTDIVKPKTVIPCYIHVGAAYEKNKTRYAIILLNEWKQVEVNPGEKVLFIELDTDKEAVIPTNLAMPSEEGIYNITLLRITSPYDINCRKPPETSYRTGIEVRSPN